MAPTAISEASVTMFVGASGLGCDNSIALANTSFAAVKVAMASSDQDRLLGPSLEDERRALSGCKRSAHPGIKW